MPEPPLDTRQESIRFVGASFEGNPIRFTANGGAPSRNGGSPSRYASDSDDSGKAVAAKGDVTGKEQGPILFEDTPDQDNLSSGLGNYEVMRLMALSEEPQHDADPHPVQDPEENLLMPSTSIVTFQVPGFSMKLAGGIVPFAEEQSVEDPDDVGLENLDIFVNP